MKEIVFNQFNNTKKNHYIPQTILRKFADEKQQLFVHDKQNNNSFLSNIENIGMKNKLYVVQNENKSYFNWEEFYSKRTDDIIPETINLLEKTVELRCIERPLSDKKLKSKLANLIISLTLRNPQRIFSLEKQHIDNLNQLLENLLISENEKNSLYNKFSDNMFYKELALESINDLKMIRIYEEIILNRKWAICVNKTNKKFIIGDNPIAIYNFINKRYGIYNGIARRDTVITFPITPEYTIIIFPNEYIWGKVYRDKRIIIEKENDLNILNSLQILCAERQIYTKDKSSLDIFL